MVSPHQEFITSSVTDVFREASAALSSIDDGMMMLKASDYILQTAFMKMTGFLEQKMKCICWEIASQSYEYRHGRLSFSFVSLNINLNDRAGTSRI